MRSLRSERRAGNGAAREEAEATAPKGYRSAGYAAALAPWGRPCHLQESDGWLLEREVPRRPGEFDAMGCYPLFCCADWSALQADLEAKRRDWVSAVLVTDPFADLALDRLETTFDVVRPFKQHWIADLEIDAQSLVSASRWRQAQNALDRLEIEIARPPISQPLLDDAWGLYRDLMSRRGVGGIRGFSADAFRSMAAVPGTVLFVASRSGRALGMHFEYDAGELVYGHLAAYSEEGYREGVAAALHVAELQHFQTRGKRFVDWGGTPGLSSDSDHGLAHFKRGFSNAQKQVFLCGKVLQPERYGALSNPSVPTDYFPAYRAGEFE